MTQFEDVGHFHAKFELPVARGSRVSPAHDDPYYHRVPGVVDDSTFLFRYQFLQEELHELLAAHRAHDLSGVADALVDLVYVALGTAHYYGIPFDEVFAEVQRANLQKVRATDPTASKRGSALDVVKPKGWEPPDVAGVIAKQGFTTGGRCGKKEGS